MSEHTAQLKRLRDLIIYYAAAFSLADRVAKVASTKRGSGEYSMAFLEGRCRGVEQTFYGSRTEALLVRLRAIEQERGVHPASEFPAFSREEMKESERDLDSLISDYSNALEAVEEKRYGSKLAAIEARLKRMEEADDQQ